MAKAVWMQLDFSLQLLLACYYVNLTYYIIAHRHNCQNKIPLTFVKMSLALE